MSKRTLLGMLTPSSNTILEPVTTEILRDLEEVSAHFGRFRVTEISLNNYGLDQFGQDARMVAANLLADAKCDVIAWNGTSAGWLGFEHDEELCERIRAETGAEATSSILANNELFRRHGVSLTRIDTRPSRTEKWAYVFFIEFEGHMQDDAVREIMRELEEQSILLKPLGSYPRAVL